MIHQPPSSPDGAAPISYEGVRRRPPWRHYWPAGGVALMGWIATALAGWQLDRWAQARDAERFASEARLVVQMIEQKMERYESVIGRLRDAFSRDNGEVTSKNWGGWLGQTFSMGENYPNAICLLVAPRVTREQRAAFEQRAATEVAGHPGKIAGPHSEADHWFPVWRRQAKAGFNEPTLGDDLLAETPRHPSFERALGATVGWVADRPSRLVSPEGDAQIGFWFVVPLRPLEFTNRVQWQWAYESGEQASRRRHEQRALQATGLLATFLGAICFCTNSTKRPPKCGCNFSPVKRRHRTPC